jgi:hypothetical protein
VSPERAFATTYSRLSGSSGGNIGWRKSAFRAGAFIRRAGRLAGFGLALEISLRTFFCLTALASDGFIPKMRLTVTSHTKALKKRLRNEARQTPVQVLKPASEAVVSKTIVKKGYI